MSRLRWGHYHAWMVEEQTIDTRYFKNIWVGFDLKHRIETANTKLRRVLV